MKIEVLKQFSIFLPNRPGALSRLTKLIGDQGINIRGIASEVRDDSGMVRIAVDDKADLSAVLSANGFASIEASLVSIEVADQPGELYRVTKILADGHVNITTVYGTALDSHPCRILVAVENTSKARTLLEA